MMIQSVVAIFLLGSIAGFLGGVMFAAWRQLRIEEHDLEGRWTYDPFL